ncbi:hypothetical protein LTR40_003380 [Exophiala xenobiotica]|nr:hypothetical protein LTR40_003380 [Exophiala xenobiotica]
MEKSAGNLLMPVSIDFSSGSIGPPPNLGTGSKPLHNFRHSLFRHDASFGSFPPLSHLDFALFLALWENSDPRFAPDS